MSETKFEVNESASTITVTRRYRAPRSKVWRAWTDSRILDQWWGPHPWRAVTYSFDFSEGGHWHYFMAGPEGEKHWCWVDYKQINAEDEFKATDSFCDEAGNKNSNLPSNDWHTQFIPYDPETEVIITISFDSPDDMNKTIEMGFEQGFNAGLEQLHAYFEANAGKTLRWQWRIFINATREKVWDTVVSKKTFPEWTKAFAEGSFYEGEWKPGEKLKFLGPDPEASEVSGMVSIVREAERPVYSSLEHVGIIKDGEEDTSSDAAKQWAPAFENYHFNEMDGGTEMVVEIDLPEEYIDMFTESWPKALELLKALCEK